MQLVVVLEPGEFHRLLVQRGIDDSVHFGLLQCLHGDTQCLESIIAGGGADLRARTIRDWVREELDRSFRRCCDCASFPVELTVAYQENLGGSTGLVISQELGGEFWTDAGGVAKQQSDARFVVRHGRRDYDDAMRLALLFACAAWLAGAPASDDPLEVIRESEDGWNSGRIERYMECYEDSPETTFVGSEVTKGTNAVLVRYRKAYPNAATMGTLKFTELQARRLSPDLAVATGRYTLERDAAAGGRKTGLFSVVLRRGAAGWRIIHDHSN